MRAVGLCILVFVAVANAEDEKICEPGSHFMDDCNSCICSDDGTDAECSRMLCPDGPSRTKRTTFPVCQPGSTMKSNGATCTCNDEGTTLHCTTKRSSSDASQHSDNSANHHRQMMKRPAFHRIKQQGSDDRDRRAIRGLWDPILPSQSRERRQVHSEDDGYRCEPNSRFKNDCNWCTCSPDGRNAMCTLIGCVHFDVAAMKPRERRQVRSEDDAYRCVPNSRFRNDCNWCTCSPDGRTAMCTLMGCVHSDVAPMKPRERRQLLSGGDDYRCVPNSSFKDDCNWCKCLPDGRGAACTDMACVGPQESNENGAL